jgi:hypothetical protein
VGIAPWELSSGLSYTIRRGVLLARLQGTSVALLPGEAHTWSWTMKSATDAFLTIKYRGEPRERITLDFTLSNAGLRAGLTELGVLT